MKKEIWFDIKVWLVVGLLLPITVRGAQSPMQLVILSLTLWASLILLFYPHKWLINNYLKKKRWPLYVLGLLGLLGLSASMLTVIIVAVTGAEDVQTAFLGTLMSVFILLLVATSISYAYRGVVLDAQFQKTKRQQIEAELKLLQSQVNPHFLFNTLNNIYAQNLVHQEEANDMILQLADLMRYQIESAKKNEVAIKDEIEFIENYLALEKKRLTERIQTSFTVDISPQLSLQIPPMLFIPFIENAYKHGISAEGACFIHIFLSIKPEAIVFKIENSVSTKKQIVKSTKMGLENIKKRLDLLFPDKHTLNVNTDNNVYSVQLRINF
jgi:two-component system, LytTR family, sensor kinase